ncbi:hypothetical protein K470DRAFT_296100 [Piedraia hortae CBS 480.64]|uniref:Uncharacterized protein n=1 Tax=Piedraia hortae CBS 480.64 TaxID=1314780 RepID=A0A6A7BVB4_9PEZI|nr:hypothetical protein K470DRAFT_296100 [Piedraia hortae CBS 480.64]
MYGHEVITNYVLLADWARISTCSSGGSRWAPMQSLSMILAGESRNENFHPSLHLFVAAGDKIKGNQMMDAIKADMTRLQCGKMAFNRKARSNRVLVGGPVTGQVDNLEASSLCSHTINSKLPCRTCLFDKLQVESSHDIITSAFRQTSENMMRRWEEMWDLDDISKKLKLHSLCHMSMWVRRFGPVIGAMTETQESTSKFLRQHTEHTNQQAISMDVGERGVITSGERHIAAGGWWCLNGTRMTRAGEGVVRLFKTPLVQGFMGLPNDHGPGTRRLWSVRQDPTSAVDDALDILPRQRYGVP